MTMMKISHPQKTILKLHHASVRAAQMREIAFNALQTLIQTIIVGSKLHHVHISKHSEGRLCISDHRPN